MEVVTIDGTVKFIFVGLVR